MSFELDKVFEAFQNKLKQITDKDSKTENSTDSALSSEESQELNTGLSGEVITSGFTEVDAENLTSGLSGDENTLSDNLAYVKTDDDGNRQSITFYGDKREGFLDLTPDSLKFYIKKYPNISKAYLSNGVVTLLDSNNSPILDANGNPVTVEYNLAKDSSKIDLVSFYLNHISGELDINKMFELKELQDKINSTPETDKSFKELQSEIEIQKLEMMSDDERKNYMTTKMWNAFNNGNKSAWFNALSEFYDYECRVIDKKLGITGAKEFIKEKTHLNKLIAYIDKVLDDKTDKLTKTELAWEIIKGIGDAIDSFIGTQGLTMMGVLGGATKAASSVPKIGPVLAGAIQAYFGTEGTILIGSGAIDGNMAQTKEQARQAGAELGLGGIMAKGGLESFKAGFRGLEVKQFRSKISESTTIEELDVIKELIEESSYPKAEKQMLRNECAKQQGKIGINNDNPPTQQNYTKDKGKITGLKDKINQQKVRSQVAYALFKLCENAKHRKMMKIILSDHRLYMALKNRPGTYKPILYRCETMEDVNARKILIDKLLENPNLLNENGTFDENLIDLILYLDTYSLEIKLDLLDEYKKSDSKLRGDAFSYILKNIEYIDTAEAFKKFLNSKDIDFDKLNEYTKEEIEGIFRITTEAKNGNFGTYCKIPLENIKKNYNLRTIASADIFGSSSKDIKYIRDKLLSDKSLQESDKPFTISYRNTDYNYSNLIKEFLEHLSVNSQPYSRYPAVKLFSDVMLDSKLGKNYKALKSIDLAINYSCYYCDIIYKALKDGVEYLSQDELKISFGERYLHRDDFSNYIRRFIENGYKPVESDIIQDDILGRILTNDRELVKDFVSNRNYTNEDLNSLMGKAHIGYGKDILADLCKQQEFSAEDIFKVMEHTLEHSVDLTKKILNVTNLTAKEKVEIIVSVDVRKPQLENLISLLINQEALDLRRIPKILKATKILDEHDAGGNNGRIDVKKVDTYVRLIQNPKTSPWVIQMLNAGWDIETISKLSPTKRNFYIDKLNGKNTEVTDKNVKFFMDFGMEQKEAEAVVKAISQSGMVNTEMQKTAVDLIRAGIPNNRIGQILSSATITGEYNSKITADAMAIKDLGLNAFVERYLPIVNNLPPEDIAVKFNPKMKKQLIAMIENIPEDTKPALRAKGFDLEGAIDKLNKEIKRTTERGQKAEIKNGFRTKSSIAGFEKVVVDKYEPIEKIWRSQEATRKWAEEKYQAIKGGKYISTRNTEQTRAEDINKQRTEGLLTWFEFMETDAEIKDNPFVRVILSDFITKDLLPENSSIPPVFDKTVVKKILSEAMKTGESFDKAYIAELNSSSKKSTEAMEVELDGRKMTWYTVPKTDSSNPDFKANVAKVRALSDGTNWCIRTGNAEPYIQQGNIHFLVDEIGMSQVCIREGVRSGYRGDNFKGTIAEIQKRQQNASVPVAYVDFVEDFITQKGLKGCESKIADAKELKPEFDKTRGKLQELADKKDYKSILEMMGIDVKVLPDGSWEISHYTSYLDKIALNDYGIKENDLLANVSKIKGNADFRDSNATSLPNLKEVDGKLNFGYADISNLKQLEKIKGKKINW